MKVTEPRPIKVINRRVTALSGDTPKIYGRWQSGLETPAGCPVWKLRLELPPSQARQLRDLNQ
jgi:hypothetical protein